MERLTYKDITEKIILQMADIVHENRYLRYENKKLRKEIDKVNKERTEKFKESEDMTNTILKAFCVDISEK